MREEKEFYYNATVVTVCLVVCGLILVLALSGLLPTLQERFSSLFVHLFR